MGAATRARRGTTLVYFDSFESLLYMEGHGVFVWPAYLITIVMLLFMVISPLRRKKKILERLAGELKRQQNAIDVIGDKV